MNRFGFSDLGIGIGPRASHFGEILSRWPKLDWFEVLSENYMDTGGRPQWVLDQVARTGPVSTPFEWDEAIPSFDEVRAEAAKAAPLRGAAPFARGTHGA